MVYYLPWTVSLESLTIIVIAIALIKILVLLIKPLSWMHLTEKIYSIPTLTVIISLILAYIVLGSLIAAGISYSEIFGVLSLLILLMVSSIAIYAKDLVTLGKKLLKDKRFWKKAWLPTLIWV